MSLFDHSPVSMARPARWLGGNLARAVAVAPTIEVLIVVVILICIVAVAPTIRVVIVIRCASIS